MKPGIIITAMAALAFAVFAVADAQGGSAVDVDHRLSGGVHIANVDAMTGDTTSLFWVLAKGEPGKANASARLLWGPLVPWPPDDERCPAGTALGTDIISFEWVETYDDGSLLTGSADPGQALCVEADGSLATEIMGGIDGGTGRFEGASGTWQATASSPPNNQSVTGTLTADLN